MIFPVLAIFQVSPRHGSSITTLDGADSQPLPRSKTMTNPLPTWCGPIAVKLLTGKTIKDQEMRSVDILCLIEKNLGQGKIVAGKGQTIREFAATARIALVFAKGHVMVVLNGELFNGCSWRDEPMTWAATW